VSKTIKNIEDLFREQFSGFELEPSSGLWPKIARKVRFRQFFRFNPGTLNIYYLGLAIILAAGSLMLKNTVFSGESGNKPREPLPEQIKSTPLIPAEAKYNKSVVDDKSRTGNKQDTEISSGVSTSQNNTGNNEPLTGRISLPASKKSGNNKRLQPEKKTDSLLKATPCTMISKPGKALKREVRADFVIENQNGCAPLTVRFRNKSVDAETYRWDFGDGAVSEEKDPVYIYDEPGQYRVRLVAAGPDGKDVSSEKLVVVATPPKADFEINTSGMNFPADPVAFHNYSENVTRCMWSFGDGSGSEEFNPVHYYKTSGEYTIKLKVWSEEGCVDSLVITNPFESSVCDIKFPNAFSPNLNGPSNGYYSEGLTTNEVFHPVCKGVLEYRLRIFNRFGTLVFESNDVNIGWDGYINGTLAKQDVYIWKARGRFTNGQNFMKFGNVTLVRKN